MKQNRDQIRQAIPQTALWNRASEGVRFQVFDEMAPVDFMGTVCDILMTDLKKQHINLWQNVTWVYE